MGDKVSISEVLNQLIEVKKYRISKSKKKEGAEYVTIQIKYQGKERVIFTGSDVIKSQLEKYKDHLPFESTIKKINNYYSFT